MKCKACGKPAGYMCDEGPDDNYCADHVAEFCIEPHGEGCATLVIEIEPEAGDL